MPLASINAHTHIAFVSRVYSTQESCVTNSFRVYMYRRSTPNGILNRAIQAEESQHHDFLRLVSRTKNSIWCTHVCVDLVWMWSSTSLEQCTWCVWQEHVEGYHELSAKTKIFFATAVSLWDADYYIKVDDDVHVNLGDTIMSIIPYHQSYTYKCQDKVANHS
jgi:hypothetical protein